MNIIALYSSPLWLTAFLLVGSAATAQNNPAGSLLVFPEFDNRAGVANVVTVTNTHNGENGAGTIDVEYVYIGKPDPRSGTTLCSEFNRTETLTPNDTLTLLPKYHTPELVQGYIYVFAKDPDSGLPVSFDYLVGSSLKVDTIYLLDYGINAATFQSGSKLSDYALTDIDDDGLRDLNGIEYEGVADEVIIPRFFGQNFFNVSELHLVALSGGVDFTTTLDFLIYNDNEEGFSREYTFQCWDRVKLMDISGIFDNDYLKNFTNHDPNEIIGFPDLESGWMRIDGLTANSSATSIPDPAFLAFLSEGLETVRIADLPFTNGVQFNGDLLASGVEGDTDNK
jgi:hypothetical protein